MYYKRSGKFNVVKTILFLVLAFAATFVTSVVYSYIMHYIPSIYLNLMVVAGAGFLFMLYLNLWVKWGEIRNVIVLLVGLIILFVTFIYVHFVGYVMVNYLKVFNLEDMISLIKAPSDLVYYVKELNSYGTWTIGSGSSSVSGIFLSALWIIEHVVVLLIMATSLKPDDIYIEAGNGKGWAIEKKVEKHLALIPESAIAQLERGDFSAIENAPLTQDPAVYSYISYFTDKNESSGEYYLNVMSETVSVDKKGKASSNTSKIVTWLRIDKANLYRLIEVLNAK